MAPRNSLKVTPSSGNVFRDLGFSSEEAEHLLIRADLLIQVQKLIASRRLKQAEVAKLLRVSQPRVSDLLRGRIGACRLADGLPHGEFERRRAQLDRSPAESVGRLFSG